ncbi:MAG: CD225/dispanin family protein [Bacteroidetes bacterium]|nr:CD225/dispanin family protein [Bacteroidota bacterium]MDA1121332.1 CD225/dispanin family protein [Bacteroidota bacterium]
MSDVRPKNWLVESILVTIFCCLPFGIAAIVNSANVNSRFDTGDIEGAKNASAAAGKWTKIGFFVGLVLMIVYFIFYAIVGVSLMNDMGGF